MKNFVVFLLILFSVLSCSIIGLNPQRKTPKKPSKYPNFTEADTLLGKLSSLRNSYDVTFYDLSVDIDIARERISGHSDIYFTCIEKTDSIQIDLKKQYKIEKVLLQDSIVHYHRLHNALIVYTKTMHAGQKYCLQLYYNGKPEKAPKPPWEGGFVWKEDKNKNPWVGVACELYGASTWWPLKDHLSDEPDSMRMSFTVPKGLYCVSNGTLENIIHNNEKDTYIWKVHYPINSYNVSFYAGDFKHFSIPYKSSYSEFDLDFYVLPYNLNKAQKHFTQVTDIISFFEDAFGEYPWSDDGYKLIESPYAGMEHQSAIAYGNGYENAPRMNFDYIILHETAHEWWGNCLSASDYAEIWLHEGFATYSEALYVEHTKGYGEYMEYLDFYSLFIKNKQPVIGPFDVNYWNYKDSDVYLKGAMILHTLRNTIDNDSVFFKVLKAFYQNYKCSIVSSSDFISLVNSITGDDYNWFFNQYLYSRVCPLLEWDYDFTKNIDSAVISYRWANVGNEFILPVQISVGSKNISVIPSDTIREITVSTNSEMYINKNNSYIALRKNKRLRK